MVLWISVLVSTIVLDVEATPELEVEATAELDVEVEIGGKSHPLSMILKLRQVPGSDRVR